MHNMGGLNRIFLIDSEAFVSLDADTGNLYTLTLADGTIMNEIKFIQDSGRLAESEQETDNGLVYNFEASLKVARTGPGDSSSFQQLRNKRMMIVARDNNEQWWLTGVPGSFFKIEITGDTGMSSQDLNHMLVKISAALPVSSVFINEPS